MTADTKTARWVDASAIYGLDSVKLVSGKGATLARVRPPNAGFRSWYYTAGRSRGGNADSKADGIAQCERWARSAGYTIAKEQA